MQVNPERIHIEKRRKRNTKPKVVDLVDFLLRNDLDTVSYFIKIIVERGQKRYSEAMFETDRRPVEGVLVNEGAEVIEFWKILSQFEIESSDHPNLGNPTISSPKKENRRALEILFAQDKTLAHLFPKEAHQLTKTLQSQKVRWKVRKMIETLSKRARDCSDIRLSLRANIPDNLSLKDLWEWDRDEIYADLVFIDGLEKWNSRELYTWIAMEKRDWEICIPWFPAFEKKRATIPYFIVTQRFGWKEVVTHIGTKQDIRTITDCIDHIEILQRKNIIIDEDLIRYLYKLQEYLESLT